jgi:glycosyltransferase involved in cell wall biosynthesis
MTNYLRILVLTKRQYTNRDLIDDRFGRIREIPMQLARNGHSVRGLCLSYRRRKDVVFQDEGVRWESINAGPLFIGGLLQFLLRSMQRAVGADVIWACSDSLFGIIAFFVGWLFGVPVVFDLYDNFESFLLARMPVFRSLYRGVVRKCDAITVASRPLHDLVASYHRTKEVFVLENAVDVSLFHPIDKNDCRAQFKLPSQALIVGTAGALFKNRGIEVLFRAFKLLASKYPDVHLAVAGPRDVPIPAHPRIHDMGILSYDQVPKFLNALDIGIICNRASAFGNYCFPQKARELMACNVPIVAARVGSMERLLEDHPGWLYNPSSPHDLVRVIANRLKNRSTGYGPLPSWSDMAGALEGICLSLSNPCTRG